MKRILLFTLVILFAGVSHAAPPAPDLFAGYSKEINSEADAKAVNVYNAWANNMKNLIKKGAKDGIVVDKAADTDQYTSDGLGNVTVKEGAKVGTIIVDIPIEDSTIIIDNGGKW